MPFISKVSVYLRMYVFWIPHVSSCHSTLLIVMYLKYISASHHGETIATTCRGCPSLTKEQNLTAKCMSQNTNWTTNSNNKCNIKTKWITCNIFASDKSNPDNFVVLIICVQNTHNQAPSLLARYRSGVYIAHTNKLCSLYKTEHTFTVYRRLT